ncbi:hypothetical protein [Xenorhabdus bharatensis]|uniref:hypothetical protein n=1 Tax=Xenorhabdus bharatensis TaxID=3136256 RepID=UPI0030F492F5
MINTTDSLLSPPSYPQAIDGKIDLQGQKDGKAKYIIMLVPHYSNETKYDKIVGYLQDTSGSHTIVSIPKIINEDPDNFISVLFPIDDFSKNTTYSGYYTITKLFSGNKSKSEKKEVTITNAYKSGNISNTVSVPQATGNDGALLTKDNYYRLDELEIIVPIYTNMQAGQVVQVLWQGPRDSYLPRYSTDTQEVSEISPLTFYIPRMQFLDGIGSTVQIWFTVKDPNDNDYSGKSETFFLTIEKQRLNLPAPRLFYRGDGTIHVIIKYDGMSPPDSVEVRAVGVTTTQSPYKPVDDPQQMGVKLKESWVNENRGKIVFIDYAVGSMIPGVRYDFSRILKQVL